MGFAVWHSTLSSLLPRAVFLSLSAVGMTACGSHADEDQASLEKKEITPEKPPAVASAVAAADANKNATEELDNTPLLSNTSPKLPNQKAEGSGWRFIIGQVPGQTTTPSSPVNTAPVPNGACQADLSLGAQVDAGERNVIAYSLGGRVSASCAARAQLRVELSTPHPVRLGGALRCGLARERTLPVQCTGVSAPLHVGNGMFQIPIELDEAKDYSTLRAIISLL